MLSILVLAVILWIKGRKIPHKSMLGLYVFIGAAGIGLLILRSFTEAGYFAEWLVGKY